MLRMIYWKCKLPQNSEVDLGISPKMPTLWLGRERCDSAEPVAVLWTVAEFQFGQC